MLSAKHKFPQESVTCIRAELFTKEEDTLLGLCLCVYLGVHNHEAGTPHNTSFLLKTETMY